MKKKYKWVLQLYNHSNGMPAENNAAFVLFGLIEIYANVIG